MLKLAFEHSGHVASNTFQVVQRENIFTKLYNFDSKKCIHIFLQISLIYETEHSGRETEFHSRIFTLLLKSQVRSLNFRVSS